MPFFPRRRQHAATVLSTAQRLFRVLRRSPQPASRLCAFACKDSVSCGITPTREDAKILRNDHAPVRAAEMIDVAPAALPKGGFGWEGQYGMDERVTICAETRGAGTQGDFE